MIVAKIKGIGRLTAIEPGSPADLKLDAGEMRIMSYGGGGSGRAEKGKAMVQAQLLSGDLKDIDSLLVVGESPLNAKLLSTGKTLLGGTKLELYFDQVFIDGFSGGIRDYLFRGAGLIGFTSAEMESIQDVEMQRTLLKNLIDLFFSSKKEQIFRLAIPYYRLQMAEGSSRIASHFTGAPKLPSGESPPLNPSGNPMLHLATLHTQEIESLAALYGLSHPEPFLSFFLDIENTEQGWPQSPNQFKVWDYREQDTVAAERETDPELGITFEQGLDLPHEDHSVIYNLHFSEEEQEQYEALYATFKSILLPRWEFESYNKLFGYPDNVQSCVAFEAERLKEGLEYSEEVYATATEWQLLLQVSPYCYKFKFVDTFGDGTMYFMIRKRDLAAGNFAEVQLVVQST